MTWLILGVVWIAVACGLSWLVGRFVRDEVDALGYFLLATIWPLSLPIALVIGLPFALCIAVAGRVLEHGARTAQRKERE